MTTYETRNYVLMIKQKSVLWIVVDDAQMPFFLDSCFTLLYPDVLFQLMFTTCATTSRLMWVSPQQVVVDAERFVM